MDFASMRSLFRAVYGAPFSHALEKRSGGGFTKGETAALVVGIVGVVLTALTVFKGWECWKARRESTVSTGDPPPHPPAITQHFHYYLPASSSPFPISPGHDIPLQPMVPQPQQQQPALFPSVSLMSSHTDHRLPLTHTPHTPLPAEVIPSSE
ncbi:hypothetical protein K440DRAFT_642226 [Wilcoxina mikolae CBS 423.85]|nr:hypothetical protein K440DRAFT_642226 [Wilcoxina mikolae CBS 423.85]